MTVFVHIGLGKTGTSTIQRALTEQSEALAALAVDVPGGRHLVTRRAVYDLMGRRIGGSDRVDRAKVAGAWAPFAESIRTSSAPNVVISEEMLALARPRVVKRLVESLAPRKVVVVVTVRDLGRVVGSYWQQMLMMGRTESLPEFLRAVRDPGQGPASAGVGFWLRQDLVRILNAWESAVPREDFRIVTVPAPGQPPDLLNDRFAEVIGVPAGLLRGGSSKGNASVGVPEAEVVRRLNVQLAGSIAENQRLNLMRVVREGLVDRDSDQIVVPSAELAWIRERSAGMVAEVAARGYRVIGSLDDLVLEPAARADAELSETQVADAAVAALAILSQDHARLWSERRARRGRRRSAQGVNQPVKGKGVGSRIRAASFRLRTKALEHADDNRLFGWAARTYLRRTGGDR